MSYKSHQLLDFCIAYHDLSFNAGVWDILLEIVAVVHKGEGITKRQWLLDAVDISCITNYPSTVMMLSYLN